MCFAIIYLNIGNNCSNKHLQLDIKTPLKLTIVYCKNCALFRYKISCNYTQNVVKFTLFKSFFVRSTKERLLKNRNFEQRKTKKRSYAKKTKSLEVFLDEVKRIAIISQLQSSSVLCGKTKVLFTSFDLTFVTFSFYH